MCRSKAEEVLYKCDTCTLLILGHIGFVDKVQETSLDTGMHNRAFILPHEQ